MFEEEFRRKKSLYVSCGMSVMKEKNFMPQVTAIMGNYLSGSICLSKVELEKALSYLTRWTTKKKKEVMETLIRTRTIIDTDTLIEDKELEALFDNDVLAPHSYVTSVGLWNYCHKYKIEKYTKPFTYNYELIKYITMSADTMFFLLEQQNDLLFKVYTFLSMNKMYWNDYKNKPYQMYIKGKGGMLVNLGYSEKSGSTVDRIRECIEFLEDNGLVSFGPQISRGKIYGHFLGYYRPLLDVRNVEDKITIKDYDLVRVPNCIRDEIDGIIYDRLIAKGYLEEDVMEFVYHE